MGFTRHLLQFGAMPRFARKGLPRRAPSCPPSDRSSASGQTPTASPGGFETGGFRSPVRSVILHARSPLTLPEMISLVTFTPPPKPCGYLPDQTWQLTYEVMAELAPEEYAERLLAGWRRFGFHLFRPTCPHCTRCQSLRIPVSTFRPDRSQRRCAAANDGDVTLRIGPPTVTDAKLALYDRFHRFQHFNKGWPDNGPESAADYASSYIQNPFDTEEWCYYLGDRLIGVGYVDRLPVGLSAIYFFYEPDERDRAPGTFNVLSVLRRAAELGLPHVYLGYYVEGCRSLEYKARFRPNEVLGADGAWQPFLG